MSAIEAFPPNPGGSETESIIRFRGVHKSYGPLPVLRDIDLSIRPGEKVALMGASGCGKSTLLRCINGLEKIDEGSLRVNGTELSEMIGSTPGRLDINRFRARIGMVFQQYNLFPHLTVLENITLGPIKVGKVSPREAAEKARALLDKVGLLEKAPAYPDQLSGGQQQRVAIARALAMEPDILLLDEPTSALDPPMSQEVFSVIEQVQGLTLVIVTHELRFVSRMADRLVFLDQGRVLAEGPPSQLLDNPSEPAVAAYLKAYR